MFRPGGRSPQAWQATFMKTLRFNLHPLREQKQHTSWLHIAPFAKDKVKIVKRENSIYVSYAKAYTALQTKGYCIHEQRYCL